MTRVAVGGLAAIILLVGHLYAAQLAVLRISVTVTSATGEVTPVPRYRLQISDNPASSVPRRVFTTSDGLVEVRLAPGNYTIESEQPVTIGGKGYQWTQTVDIAAGRDHVLTLNADNATLVDPGEAPPPSTPDASSLLAQWQASLVTIWTATTRGTGIVMGATDTRGLVVTDQVVIGGATTVEVQLSPTLKVAGNVLASDATRGIALIHISPERATASPLPLVCDTSAEPIVVGQDVTALEAPLGRRPWARSGEVSRVLVDMLDTDLQSSAGASGGPVFAPSGQWIGVTTQVAGDDDDPSGRTRIVRIGRVCELMASTAAALAKASPPAAAALPVESTVPFPAEALTPGSAGANTDRYRLSSSDFDITFLTPPWFKDAGDRFVSDPRMPTGFANWADYVETTPPVVLIRVTPKLTEGFWTKVARGALTLQGVSLPPITRLKPDFASMRVLCGTTPVVPIHPFRLEHRLTPTDTLVEGLYTFDPDALSPECATVTLQLFSEKNPKVPDTVMVDAKLIAQVWQDFAPHRAVRSPQSQLPGLGTKEP
jgi:Trypsin-like peptidase domain